MRGINSLGHQEGAVYRSTYWKANYVVVETTADTTTVLWCGEGRNPEPSTHRTDRGDDLRVHHCPEPCKH